MASRCQRGVMMCRSARVWRVDSINRPKGTPLGQAGSQPRHCTHVSIERTTSSSRGAPSFCTARMRAMRPRGEAMSSPVAR